ncbi:ATP-binding protein [Bartonella taylorii]|uniref:ATP-binding protein n=1 Tax=Bartonella taylorii TaxID=33046 RepID=UPI00208F8891|nr:ATP-binding protein [Bartonella taylorii]USP01759.1 ATP-binding protein [Bartonella taylorii]
MENVAVQKQEKNKTEKFSMKENLAGRVYRFPKPSTEMEALQPVFEAVSNAIHALEDSKQEDYKSAGNIDIEIKDIDKNETLEIIVKDNGVGLDDEHFQAFRTVDTNFKLEKGGKGVGRLLWLDTFKKIRVKSIFLEEDQLYQRSFTFCLEEENQILDHSKIPLINQEVTGTEIIFTGLRDVAYQKYFPRKTEAIIDHIGAHFFSDLILEQLPQITFRDDQISVNLAQKVKKYLVENRGEITLETADFGLLKIRNFICMADANLNFKGKNHYLHLFAHDRTVTTESIDNLIGFGKFGTQKLVYHGCISGQYLDDRVNQERTHFSFKNSILKDILRAVANNITQSVLAPENEEYERKRLNTLKKFCKTHPSYRFESYEKLLETLPKAAKNTEGFVKTLAIHKLRREKKQNKRIEEIYREITEGNANTDSFSQKVSELAREVKDEETRQLAEYVIRRKVILKILEGLIIELKKNVNGQEVPHLEKTLHKLICPMRVRGDDPESQENLTHDLWIIDERLTFTKYFASDVPINQIIQDSTEKSRPDLLCYNQLYALGLEGRLDADLDRLMLVEFKRPGQKKYKAGYTPMEQINKYLNKLKGKSIKTFDNKKIKISEQCVFYCYIIADIEGELKTQTSTWQKTANGRGRTNLLQGDFRGSVEIIEWNDLLQDAKLRNEAFISRLKV